MLWTEFLVETVVFKTVSPTVDGSGSAIPSLSTGTSLSAKVDAKTTTRVTDHGAILAETAYTIYAADEPTDTSSGKRLNTPTCRVDDVFVWGGKTLAALGAAQDMSALGETMWRVMAKEIA